VVAKGQFGFTPVLDGSQAGLSETGYRRLRDRLGGEVG
jgi:hypothetical protein